MDNELKCKLQKFKNYKKEITLNEKEIESIKIVLENETGLKKKYFDILYKLSLYKEPYHSFYANQLQLYDYLVPNKLINDNSKQKHIRRKINKILQYIGNSGIKYLNITRQKSNDKYSYQYDLRLFNNIIHNIEKLSKLDSNYNDYPLTTIQKYAMKISKQLITSKIINKSETKCTKSVKEKYSGYMSPEQFNKKSKTNIVNLLSNLRDTTDSLVREKLIERVIIDNLNNQQLLLGGLSDFIDKKIHISLEFEDK